MRGEIGGECCSNGERDAAAFVGQDDRFYSHLSVRETLLVAAKLRLPRLGGAESQDVVDELLRQLHLSHVRSELPEESDFPPCAAWPSHCGGVLNPGPAPGRAALKAGPPAARRDTMVGDERSRGISGGERRRLALGCAAAAAAAAAASAAAAAVGDWRLWRAVLRRERAGRGGDRAETGAGTGAVRGQVRAGWATAAGVRRRADERPRRLPGSRARA